MAAKFHELRYSENLDRLANILWLLWKHRNGIVFGEQVFNDDTIWKATYQLDERYKIACYRRQLVISNEMWQKPNRGWLKLNTDASWRKSINQGAAGFVCRDDRGTFVGARFIQIPKVASPIVAEALALRYGVEFALMHNWRRLEVESDSKMLFQMLTGHCQPTMEVEVLVGDILYLTTALEVKFQFTKRSTNNVAPTVANWIHGGVSEATWLHSPPS
ncbi:hypothetical protein LIER_13172 [Lithospermum erythrorhizon]|uniref:RNase H type-1 domain-containing protein n=1 Tax=Lithospermum erythrorhizon TaxID=34254 RepID=A0AAV3PW33_LITER